MTWQNEQIALAHDKADELAKGGAFLDGAESSGGNMEKQVWLRGIRVRSMLVELKEAGWNRSWRWNQGTLKEAFISLGGSNKTNVRLAMAQGTDEHRLYECIGWHKVRLQSEDEVRCCEQIARTSAKQWL